MMNLADNTMVYFGAGGLTLTFMNYDATPTVLERDCISKGLYSELYKHLAKGESVWDFEDRRVFNYDDPLDIVDVIGCEFHALVGEDNISEVIMQGIANEVILQNHKKLQEIGR